MTLETRSVSDISRVPKADKSNKLVFSQWPNITRDGTINATILPRSNLLRAGQIAKIAYLRGKHDMIKRGALAQPTLAARKLVAASPSLLDGRRVTLFFLF